jgi:hypothetical protein
MLARMATVAHLMGHSRLDTDAIYTQPGRRDLEKAVEKLADPRFRDDGKEARMRRDRCYHSFGFGPFGLGFPHSGLHFQGSLSPRRARRQGLLPERNFGDRDALSCRRLES